MQSWIQRCDVLPHRQHICLQTHAQIQSGNSAGTTAEIMGPQFSYHHFLINFVLSRFCRSTEGLPAWAALPSDHQEPLWGSFGDHGLEASSDRSGWMWEWPGRLGTYRQPAWQPARGGEGEENKRSLLSLTTINVNSCERNTSANYSTIPKSVLTHHFCLICPKK